MYDPVTAALWLFLIGTAYVAGHLIGEARYDRPVFGWKLLLAADLAFGLWCFGMLAFFAR